MGTVDQLMELSNVQYKVQSGDTGSSTGQKRPLDPTAGHSGHSCLSLGGAAEVRGPTYCSQGVIPQRYAYLPCEHSLMATLHNSQPANLSGWVLAGHHLCCALFCLSSCCTGCACLTHSRPCKAAQEFRIGHNNLPGALGHTVGAGSCLLRCYEAV